MITGFTAFGEARFSAFRDEKQVDYPVSIQIVAAVKLSWCGLCDLVAIQDLLLIWTSARLGTRTVGFYAHSSAIQLFQGFLV